jgi:2-keto-3-deoxy-L-arabinonate dehydratase
MALLAEEVPTLTYAKIETAQAAEKIRALRSSAATTLPGVFDGEEGVTLLPDLDAGAVGTMTSCTAPEVIAEVVDAYTAGDRPRAVALWEALLPMLHYENRLCGLRATKILLREGGVIASSATRSPIAPVSAAVEAGLLELAQARDVLALRWGR